MPDPLKSRRTDTNELWRQLHARVFNGDPQARGDAAAHIIERVYSWLRLRYRRTDPFIVYDGVVDAVMEYLSRPSCFSPDRSSLTTFIAHISKKNIETSLRSERRRRRRDAAWCQSLELREQDSAGVDCMFEALGDALAKRRDSENLSDREWCALRRLLPEERRARGQPPYSHRLLLEGILWKLVRAARWEDLPTTYPPPKTCQRYYMVWSRDGHLARIMQWLCAEAATNNLRRRSH